MRNEKWNEKDTLRETQAYEDQLQAPFPEEDQEVHHSTAMPMVVGMYAWPSSKCVTAAGCWLGGSYGMERYLRPIIWSKNKSLQLVCSVPPSDDRTTVQTCNLRRGKSENAPGSKGLPPVFAAA